jgi:hypothetical protein
MSRPALTTRLDCAAPARAALVAVMRKNGKPLRRAARALVIYDAGLRKLSASRIGMDYMVLLHLSAPLHANPVFTGLNVRRRHAGVWLELLVHAVPVQCRGPAAAANPVGGVRLSVRCKRDVPGSP